MYFDDDINEEPKRNSTSTEDNAIFSKPNRINEPEHVDSSIFGDGSCGEPLAPQHIVLDFTPIEEIDNEFVQKKCCAFWDFIRSQPEFHDLLILPERADNVSTGSDAEGIANDVSDVVEKEPDEELKSPTALSMLEFIQGKGLINGIFDTKMPQSHCSLGPEEYKEDRESTAKGCPCGGACKMCIKQLPKEPASSSTAEVRAMCENMKEWDYKHPKSMEPPGQPPALTQ